MSKKFLRKRREKENEFLKSCRSSLVNSLSGNLMEKAIEVHTSSPPYKLISIAKKRLIASDDYSLCDDTVYNVYGNSVNAIAVRAGIICVHIRSKPHRYKILVVFYNRKHYIFAIPINMVDKSFKLPGLDFSNEEMELLLAMANDISHPNENVEVHTKVKHPAKQHITYQTSRFSHARDNKAFLEMLIDEPHILECLLPALDVQLRSFKRFKDAPCGVYNFTSGSSDIQDIDQLKSILTAANFAYSDNYANAKPAEFKIKDESDLNVFNRYSDRIILAQVGNSSVITDKLLEIVGEREIQRKFCSNLPDRLETVPILLSKRLLPSDYVYNIEISGVNNPLEYHELDLIRATCKSVLNREIAQKVYDNWRYIMSYEYSYNISTFTAWTDTIKRTVLHSIAGQDNELLELADDIIGNIKTQRRDEEEKRTELIQKAIDKIKDYESFKDKIIDRPKTKAIANDKLSDEAYAFWFTPQKGADQGQKFLAFNKISLLRLLRSIGIDEALYEMFLEKAETAGLLQDKNRSISLSGETFNAITFCT